MVLLKEQLLYSLRWSSLCYTQLVLVSVIRIKHLPMLFIFRLFALLLCSMALFFMKLRLVINQISPIYIFLDCSDGPIYPSKCAKAN